MKDGTMKGRKLTFFEKGQRLIEFLAGPNQVEDGHWVIGIQKVLDSHFVFWASLLLSKEEVDFG